MKRTYTAPRLTLNVSPCGEDLCQETTVFPASKIEDHDDVTFDAKRRLRTALVDDVEESNVPDEQDWTTSLW